MHSLLIAKRKACAERYRRQLILNEVGATGQARLEQARVLIVGAGGLGSPAALYLAAAGVGTIGLVDSDVVDLSNLQRQILHSTDHLGTPKTQSAKERLSALNPHIKINTYQEYLNADNIRRIMRDYDLVINAVDNVETRYLLNDTCLVLNIPLIEGAIYHFEGYVMTILPKMSPCYRCLFPIPPQEKSDEMIGVVGGIAGIIGTMQAMEAMKYFLQRGELLSSRMLYYDALNAKFRDIKTQRDPHCPVCAS